MPRRRSKKRSTYDSAPSNNKCDYGPVVTIIIIIVVVVVVVVRCLWRIARARGNANSDPSARQKTLRVVANHLACTLCVISRVCRRNNNDRLSAGAFYKMLSFRSHVMARER